MVAGARMLAFSVTAPRSGVESVIQYRVEPPDGELYHRQTKVIVTATAVVVVSITSGLKSSHRFCRRHRRAAALALIIPLSW